MREAYKHHHPPGTIPSSASESSENPGVKFKEVMIENDDSSDTMRGVAVSSGTITAKASVILGAAPWTLTIWSQVRLWSHFTTPAWTQLFAHAVGLVTDISSIFAHGSIVAREYGIPAVLGVGHGTKRILHG